MPIGDAFMKPFIVATLLTISCSSLLFGCGSRGFSTADAATCDRFCAQQDGQTGTFDKTSKNCSCSEVAVPES